MTDLVFFLRSGEQIPTDLDCNEAVHDGEFEPWHVRWVERDRGAPFVRLGDRIVRLVAVEGSYELPEQVNGAKKEKINVRFAGLVTLYADAAGT